jgi:uncharacterized protein YcbK (DUF882 family)
VRQDDKYFYWNKGEVEKLSEHFSTQEFDCHCKYKTCVEQKMAKAHIAKLEAMRSILNKPMGINSGFRCSKYQAYLRKAQVNTVVAEKSQHELGHASDPTCKVPISDLVKAAEKAGFEAIGTAATFVHVDDRTGKKRRWKY